MNKLLPILFLTIFLIGMVSANTWAGNLSNSIFAYWNMDENSGTVITDSISGRTGTDAITNEEGIIGKAINCTGTLIPVDSINSTTRLNSNDATLSAWVFPYGTGGSDGIIISRLMGFGTPEYALVLDNANQVYTFVGNSDTNIALVSSNLTLGQWAYIVEIKNSTSICLYVNGEIKACELYDGTWFPYDSGILSFCRRADGYYPFYGMIDEVGIWNRSLSSEEISLLYNSGNGCAYGNESCFEPPTPPAPINSSLSYYNMDEPSGTNMIDSWGRYNATNNVALVNQEGVIGRAYKFDGVGQKAIPLGISTDEFSNGVGKASISFWIKFDSFDEGVQKFVLTNNWLDSGLYLRVGVNGNKPYFENTFHGTIEGTQNLSTGVWYHWVIMFGADGMNFYVNNVSIGTNPATTFSNANDGAGLELGISHFYNVVNATVDELYIFNETLPQEDISELYSAGLPPPPTPPHQFSSTGQAIYDIVNTSGAGLGIFMTFLGQSLPILLIGLAFAGLIVAVVFSIKNILIKAGSP